MRTARDNLADEPAGPVTVVEAAREMNVSAETVRRWIRSGGAPTVREGCKGSGNGALVDVGELRAWRARRAGVDDGRGVLLDTIAQALLETHRRDAGDGRPAHEVLGFHSGRAAVYLLEIFDRAHLALKGGRFDPEDVAMPAAIRQLLSIIKTHTNVRTE